MPRFNTQPIVQSQRRYGKPTALGIHIFAGGFSLGVRQAGFEILAHLEDTNYGVSTAKANWPDLDVRIGEANWHEEGFTGQVDLIFSNPPCAIFSCAGISTTRGSEAWRTDPRLQCWYRAFRVFEKVKPKVFMLESVTQAYTKGREVIDEFTKRAIKLGYSVTHLLLDGCYVGLPQYRKRFVIVIYHPWLPLEFRFDFTKELMTVGDVLATVDSPGEYTLGGVAKSGVDAQQLIENCQPGEGLCTTFDRIITNPKLNAHGRITGKPSFNCYRLKSDKPMGAFVSNFYIHPTENRYLGINEMKAICGYPQEFILEGKSSHYASLLARAVLPPVGYWLADSSLGMITMKARRQSLPTVTLTDLRKPPGKYEDLTDQYIPERVESKLHKLTILSNRIKSCDMCPRMRGRMRVLSQTNGNVNAKLLFVGEAPGRKGAGQTGLPFYGDEAGSNFEQLLQSIDLTYDDVFITNAVLCNPLGPDGKNDSPTIQEVSSCSNHLRAVIRLINPGVVITLGSVALEAIKTTYPHNLVLKKDVGKFHDWYGRKLFPLYHTSPRVLMMRSFDKQLSDWEPLRTASLTTFDQTTRPRVIIPTKSITPRTNTVMPLTSTNNTNEKPLPNEGSGKFIQRLWMTGKYFPEELVQLVHTNYSGRTTTVGDVRYNYYKLLESSIANVPPWPTKTKQVKQEKILGQSVTQKNRIVQKSTITPLRSNNISHLPRVLLTGSTAIQCGSPRTKLKIVTAASCWVTALQDMGYEVDHRAVQPGEDLSRYEKVITILNPPNSLTSKYVHGAIWSLIQREDAIIALDDWQVNSLINGLASCARLPERLFRLWGQKIASGTRKQIYDLVVELDTSDWRWPIIVPLFDGGNISLLNISANSVISIDPTSYAHRYVVIGKRHSKLRQWIQASLLRKPLLETSWPIIGYGNPNKKEGRGKAGINAQQRLIESELAQVYAKSFGCISPSHYHSGSGWWRYRYLMSADARCILSADRDEAAVLGGSYLEACDKDYVESLSDESLWKLARSQNERLEEVAWSKERVKDVLSSLLSKVKVHA